MDFNKAKLALMFPNLEGYKAGPCAYVRWLELEDKFYVGVSKNLLGRYKGVQLREIIYFEEFTGINAMKKATEREYELIKDFLEAKLPMANNNIGPLRYIR